MAESFLTSSPPPSHGPERMKVRTAVRRLCAGCFVVRRRGKIFIVCKLDARHKQRQGFHTLALEAARAAPDPPAQQSRTLGPPDARAPLVENPWAHRWSPPGPLFTGG